MDVEPEWMVPPNRDPASGDGVFHGSAIRASVADFWRFALGDLRMNNARGYLAEFIVAKALGIENVNRVEWDAFDILWEGIPIEVKSSAYLQVWEQRRHSAIKFSGLKGTRYHPRHDYDPLGKRFNAHVYVFCVQNAKTHEEYDPLALNQWEFYVVSRNRLAERGYASIGLNGVQALAGSAIRLSDMRSAVLGADADQARADDAAEWWLASTDV